jgi:predicted kinase
VAAHARELHARARRGCVREGHGDLRAEHVLLDGEVQVVDGVEFDRELRELDVADDLAFLVCDLAALGGERFAKLLVAEYRSAGGDPGPDSLLAFYAAYRALVRAKVALLQAAQAPPRSAAHGRASKTGRDLIVTAERFAWRARLPLAIAVCGRPASGKSNVARALAETSGLPHLSSDETRKRLAQIRPAERGAAEIYAADWNARTYRELGRRAAAAITQTGGAIVDATFRHRADRASFRSAFAARAPVLFVECLAPAAVLAKRAAVRASDPARVSDADPQVVQDLLGDWDALDEVGPDEHLALRTDRPQEEVVGDVIALLDQRLLRLAT